MSSKFPPFLSQLFSLPSSHYNTCSTSSSQLNLPPNRSSFGLKSFSFMGAALWWSLPQNIRDTRDFARFYSLCQRHFYLWYLTFIACMCMMIFLWLIPHYSLLLVNHRTSAWSYLSAWLWLLTLFCTFSFLYWVPQSGLWLTVPQLGKIRFPDLWYLIGHISCVGLKALKQLCTTVYIVLNII